jgi:hypothetical protein
MESDSFAHGIFLIALFLCFSQPQLSAQAEAAGTEAPPNENNSWAATTESRNLLDDSTPTKTNKTHTEFNGRTLDRTVTEGVGSGGGYNPYLETERETVRVDSSTVRTVERVFGRDPNGGRALIRVTEEEKRNLPGGDTKILRTVSNSTVNGALQVVERDIQETRHTSPDVRQTTTTVLTPDVNGGFAPSMRRQEEEKRTSEHEVQFKRSTLLPDVNGDWQVNEVREGNIKQQDGQNDTKEENVLRRTADGNLSVVERTVTKQSESVPGERRKTVETYSKTVPGGFGDGGLILNQRVTTVQRLRSDGGTTTEQKLEQKNPGEPSGDMRLTQKTIDIVGPGTNGTSQGQQTIQSVDPNGALSTVWVDTRHKAGDSPIMVDTRKGNNSSPAQPSTGVPPKP